VFPELMDASHFSGKEPGTRMVQIKGNIENIKNLPHLDGAFAIGGSGFIYAVPRIRNRISGNP
jgi:hypothetical protein